MRVNVSYSVELDEVLNEVRQLYQRESNKLSEVLLSAERSLATRSERAGTKLT